VANARQILHAAAADHDDRVLLQVMALARDVADHLEAVGEAHLGDLAQRRVRLLRRRRIDARADPALLRTGLQRRHLVARFDRDPRLADQLVDGRHARLSPVFGPAGLAFIPASRISTRATPNRAIPQSRAGWR